jgi:putative pyruvate formate lyase activating enzyme
MKQAPAVPVETSLGTHGSGTIFFSNCNLRCIFCQNFSISQLGEGKETSKEDLARIMLYLQNSGCHNINLVSPTHVVPQIIESLEIAIELGLRLPLVYNTGGYDRVETLRLLDGIIDIYMPDMKYSNEKTARELSGIEDYPMINQAAVSEMHRQVGDLQIDENGVAVRGLLIRHLILPGGLSGSDQIFSFISHDLSKNSYVNIMDQYRPCYKAAGHKQLDTAISDEELRHVMELASEYGLERLDKKYTSIIKILRSF